MNHKGQSLVLFILLLPIILIAMAFVVDIGLLTDVKKDTDQKLEQLIESGLINHLDEEKWTQLIDYNFENIESKHIIVNDDSIEISIQIKLTPIFPHIMLQKRYQVTYVGYMEIDQIKIIRK